MGNISGGGANALALLKKIEELEEKIKWKLAGTVIGNESILIPNDWKEILIYTMPYPEAQARTVFSAIVNREIFNFSSGNIFAVHLNVDFIAEGNENHSSIINIEGENSIKISKFVWSSIDITNSGRLIVYYR